MSRGKPRPRRPLRREIMPLALAAALPLALVSAFPRETLDFRPSDGAAPVASCAFVALSPAAERRAIAAVRAAWQTGAEDARGLRAEMFGMSLAEFAPDEVVGFAVRRTPPSVDDVRFAACPTPPSVAASAPEPLPASEPQTSDPAFSRTELLRIPDWVDGSSATVVHREDLSK